MDGRGWVKTAGDCGGRPGMGEDGGGRPGTERVMSHDATRIHSEIYGINFSRYWREIVINRT